MIFFRNISKAKVIIPLFIFLLASITFSSCENKEVSPDKHAQDSAQNQVDSPMPDSPELKNEVLTPAKNEVSPGTKTLVFYHLVEEFRRLATFNAEIALKNFSTPQTFKNFEKKMDFAISFGSETYEIKDNWVDLFKFFFGGSLIIPINVVFVGENDVVFVNPLLEVAVFSSWNEEGMIDKFEFMSFNGILEEENLFVGLPNYSSKDTSKATAGMHMVEQFSRFQEKIEESDQKLFSKGDGFDYKHSIAEMLISNIFLENMQKNQGLDSSFINRFVARWQLGREEDLLKDLELQTAEIKKSLFFLSLEERRKFKIIYSLPRKDGLVIFLRRPGNPNIYLEIDMREKEKYKYKVGNVVWHSIEAIE